MSCRDVKLTTSQITRITNAMRRWLAMKKVHILKMDKNSVLAAEKAKQFLENEDSWKKSPDLSGESSPKN